MRGTELHVFMATCVVLQHPGAGTADGDVAQLDDQRGGVLWKVRQAEVWHLYSYLSIIYNIIYYFLIEY